MTTVTSWKFKRFGNFWGALEYTLRRGFRAKDSGVVDDLHVFEEEMKKLRLNATENLATVTSTAAPIESVSTLSDSPTTPSTPPSARPVKLPASTPVDTQKSRSISAQRPAPSTPTARRKMPSRARNTEPIEIRGSSEEDIPKPKGMCLFFST